jgi:hypothetical protein
LKDSIFRTVLPMLVFAVTLDAQTASKPEIGLVSPSAYTNLFFGFSLPLPQNVRSKPLVQSGPPGDAYRHFLFAAISTDKGYSAIVIGADEMSGSRMADPKRTLMNFGAQKVDVVRIGGKEFSRGKWQADNIYSIAYATPINGYMLFMFVCSYDQEVLREFQRKIQTITFLDPAKAKEYAGPDGQPYQGPITTSP